jgi:hypothetical protein
VAELSKCQGCGAAIRFVKTEAGRWMPLEPDPDPEGTVVVGADGLARVLTGGLFDEPAEGERYVPHWAKCPKSKDFKRGKKA